MLASIYYGLFQSVATYGIVSWRSADDTYLGKLKNLQKRAISIVFGDHNQPLNIPQCYFLEALMIEYPKLKKKYNDNTTSTRRRNISIPKNNKDKRKKSYIFQASIVFNDLPQELKLFNGNTSIIRSKLKNWLKNYKV